MRGRTRQNQKQERVQPGVPEDLLTRSVQKDFQIPMYYGTTMVWYNTT